MNVRNRKLDNIRTERLRLEFQVRIHLYLKRYENMKELKKEINLW